MKDLSIQYPLDKHLKPVKDSDSNVSALEISTEKVRVKDLEVTGTTTGVSAPDNTKLPLSGGTMAGTIDADGNNITNIGGLSVETMANSASSIDTIDHSSSLGTSSSTLPTQGAVKSYVDNTIRDIKASGFNYSSTAGTKVYIPLGSSTTESTSLTNVNEFRPFVVPFDGFLDQVVIRSEEACGSTIVGLHKSSTGTEIPNSTASATVTVNMTADDTAFKFDFTSSNTFSAGDIIAISFDPTNDANDTNATIVLVYDGSQGV